MEDTTGESTYAALQSIFSKYQESVEEFCTQCEKEQTLDHPPVIRIVMDAADSAGANDKAVAKSETVRDTWAHFRFSV